MPFFAEESELVLLGKGSGKIFTWNIQNQKAMQTSEEIIFRLFQMKSLASGVSRG